MNTHRYTVFVHPLDNSVQYLLSSNQWFPDCKVTSFANRSFPVANSSTKVKPYNRVHILLLHFVFLALGWLEIASVRKEHSSSTWKCCDKKRQPVPSSVFCFYTLQLSITHHKERLNTLDNGKPRQLFFFCPLSDSVPQFLGCSFPGCQDAHGQ